MPIFRIIRLKFGRRFGCLWAISLSAVWISHAQLDPEPRHLQHVGVSQSLHHDGPQAHDLFASARAFEELRNARVPIRSL